jgi:hypothetical protein
MAHPEARPSIFAVVIWKHRRNLAAHLCFNWFSVAFRIDPTIAHAIRHEPGSRLQSRLDFSNELLRKLDERGFTMEQLAAVLCEMQLFHAITPKTGFTNAMLPPGYEMKLMPRSVHWPSGARRTETSLDGVSHGDFNGLVKLLQYIDCHLLAEELGIGWRFEATLIGSEKGETLSRAFLSFVSLRKITLESLARGLVAVDAAWLIRLDTGFNRALVDKHNNPDGLHHLVKRPAPKPQPKLDLESLHPLLALVAAKGETHIPERHRMWPHANHVLKTMNELSLIVTTINFDFGTIGLPVSIVLTSEKLVLRHTFGSLLWTVHRKADGHVCYVYEQELQTELVPVLERLGGV